MKLACGALAAAMMLPGLGWAQAKDSQAHHENAQKPVQPRKTLADPVARHSVDVAPMTKGDGGMKELNRLERAQPHMRLAKPAKTSNKKIDFTYRAPQQAARNPAVPKNERDARKPH